jgi:hypothetical protein
VELFGRWLAEAGHDELALSFEEGEVLRSLDEAERAGYVTSREVMELARSWGTYQGQPIGEDRVRAWLNQFGAVKNQRLMFNLLRSLRFYSQALVREKMREAYGPMLRDVTLIAQSAKKGLDRPQRLKRDDILLSYIDGPGKSGSIFAKLFADENKIYFENIWEQSRMRRYLDAEPGDDRFKAIVFVDDFVGTGTTACEGFCQMLEGLSRDDWKQRLQMFFLVVSGFKAGLITIERYLHQHDWPVKIHACDVLDDRDSCFHPSAQVFADERERISAREMVRDIGERIEKKQPLGYGGVEALVVFGDTCPNNTLPVLWKNGAEWTALFPRS